MSENSEEGEDYEEKEGTQSEKEKQGREEDLEKKEKHLKEKEKQLEEREKQLERRTEEIEEKKENFEQKEKELDELEAEIDEKKEVLEEREDQVEKRIEEFEKEKEREKERFDELIEGTKQVSSKPQTAGGVLLMFTGLITLVASFWLLAAVATGTTPLNLIFNPASMAGLGILGSILIGEISGSGISVSLNITQIIFIGVIFLILAIIEIVGGWQAYQTKKWYFTTITGIIALIMVFPLGLVSIFLTTISEARFTQKET